MLKLAGKLLNGRKVALSQQKDYLIVDLPGSYSLSLILMKKLSLEIISPMATLIGSHSGRWSQLSASLYAGRLRGHNNSAISWS